MRPGDTFRTYGLALRVAAPGGAGEAGAGDPRHVPVILHDEPPPAGWRPLTVPPGIRTQARYALGPGGGRVLLRYPGGPAFAVGSDAIEVYGFAGLPPEELRWYLLGPVSAFHLRLRGRLLLHASALRRDGCTVAFAGPAGSGKSTLAAALVARGALGVTDDVLVVERGAEGAWHVHPGPPRHLLWPDAAAALATAAGGGEPLGPNPCRWDKRALPPLRWSDPSVLLPLDRLLLLAPAAAAAAAEVRACPPGRAVAVLVGSLHAGWFGDARRRRTDLHGAADLVGTLGARELVVPRDLARLPEVAAMVEDELREDGP